MAYKRSKYSVQQTQCWSVAAMSVLSEAQEALTCEQIKRSDLLLTDVTPQKLSRILSELVTNGFVTKTKGRDGRMRYKSIAVLQEQGYDISTMIY